VDHILNTDDGRHCDEEVHVRPGYGIRGCFRSHRLFYDETVLSIIKANSSGK
jgi:hypothetical protein